MYYPMGFYYDPTYILIIIGVLLSMAASAKVNSTYQRYASVGSRSGLTGAQVAQQILNSQGIYDVAIRHVAGNLTDHYDPRTKTVNLSDGVYGSTSIAAVGVAAHECGHAIQDAREYTPLRLRAALVPAANLGAQISWPLIIFGAIIGGTSLISVGILLFFLSVLFQLVTLPVEFNASGRALKLLDSIGILGSDEVGKARQVLSAAALTYVAAAAGSILQLLRLWLLFGNRRRRD